MTISARHKAHIRDTKIRPYRLGGALGLLGVLFLTGCGRGSLPNANNNIQDDLPTVDQCNQLAKVVNQTQGFMKEFETEIQTFRQSATQVENLKNIQSAAIQYTTAVDKVVTNLDGLTSDLQATALKDDSLIQFRDGYVEIVQGFSSALKDAGKAMDPVAEVRSESEFPSKFQEFKQKTMTAKTAIEDLSQIESQLINEVNAYCGGETSTQGGSETTKENSDSSTEDYPGQTENIEEFGRERYEELSKCQDELIAKGATAEEIVETCDFSEEEEITPLSQEEAEELLCSEAKNDPSNPWYSDCLQKGF